MASGAPDVWVVFIREQHILKSAQSDIWLRKGDLKNGDDTDGPCSLTQFGRKIFGLNKKKRQLSAAKFKEGGGVIRRRRKVRSINLLIKRDSYTKF